MRLAAVAAGERLGRYEIVRHLATGGMAEIYLARSEGIGDFERYVVVKVIAGDRRADPQFVRMFLDEARLAAALNHANVAQVYEVGEATGELYYAMEYVHGDNARTVLEDCARLGTTIPLETALAIAIGAASGLHHAHDRVGPDGKPLAIVHRDVSPSNIMVGYDGQVKVLDFGIARAGERPAETESGVVKGKYAYMAPEQCRAQPLDRRADVFALGIVLYELATQCRAFKSDNDFETMLKITTGDLVPPTTARPGLPAALEVIILRALAVEPRARFQTARELGDALEGFAEHAGLSISQRAVERFMHAVYGARPEPWHTATSPPALALRLPLFTSPSATSAPRSGTPIHAVAAPPEFPASSSYDTSMAPAIEIITEAPPARSIARPVALGLGAMALAIAAVVAIAASSGGDDEPKPANAVAGPASTTTPPAVTARSHPPASGAAAAPPAALASTVEPDAAPTAAVPPADVATVTLELRSEPPGAAVFLAGRREGTTPLTLTVPRSATPLALRLERSGSRSLTVELPVDHDLSRTLKLAPRRKQSVDDETFTNPFAK